MCFIVSACGSLVELFRSHPLTNDVDAAVTHYCYVKTNSLSLSLPHYYCDPLFRIFRNFRFALDTGVKKDDGSSFRNILQKASEELLSPEESLDFLPGKKSNIMIFYQVRNQILAQHKSKKKHPAPLNVHLIWCTYSVPYLRTLTLAPIFIYV